MIVDHGFQRRLLYFEILSGGLHGCEKYIIFHKKEIALKGQALIQIKKNVTTEKSQNPFEQTANRNSGKKKRHKVQNIP